jgi:hypothetical protein
VASVLAELMKKAKGRDTIAEEDETNFVDDCE